MKLTDIEYDLKKDLNYFDELISNLSFIKYETDINKNKKLLKNISNDLKFIAERYNFWSKSLE